VLRGRIVSLDGVMAGPAFGAEIHLDYPKRHAQPVALTPVPKAEVPAP
jgi:hypothetical protein